MFKSKEDKAVITEQKAQMKAYKKATFEARQAEVAEVRRLKQIEDEANRKSPWAYVFSLAFISPLLYQLYDTFYAGEWGTMFISALIFPLGWALGVARLFGYT